MVSDFGFRRLSACSLESRLEVCEISGLILRYILVSIVRSLGNGISTPRLGSGWRKAGTLQHDVRLDVLPSLIGLVL